MFFRRVYIPALRIKLAEIRSGIFITIPHNKAATLHYAEIMCVLLYEKICLLLSAVYGVVFYIVPGKKAAKTIALSKDTSLFRAHHHPECAFSTFAYGHEITVRYAQFARQTVEYIELAVHVAVTVAVSLSYTRESRLRQEFNSRFSC